MPSPEITGVGAGLKRNGTSNLWIRGNNIQPGDRVEILLGGDLIYVGRIVNSRDNLHHAQLQPTRNGVDRNQRDLEHVSITVTNEGAGETSPSYPDDVIIDAP